MLPTGRTFIEMHRPPFGRSQGVDVIFATTELPTLRGFECYRDVTSNIIEDAPCSAMPSESNFGFCPHCAAKGKPRELRPATRRTPHISRSDTRTCHLFLEELNVSCPSGTTEQQVAALFRYDLDPRTEKSESTLVMIRPGGLTEELVLRQLEQSADRLAAILGEGNALQKTYSWSAMAITSIDLAHVMFTA